MFIKNTWYIAAWADELKDKPFARTVCNEPIVLYRDLASGKAAALEDRCCHRGTPLRFGQIVDAGLECGYHGLVFDCEGSCVRIPGQAKIPPKARVRSYPLVEKDEFLWIWMGDPESADESRIIDYPFHNDYARWPHKHAVYHIKCNYMLLVDNLMDLTHLGYVHRGTIGGDPRAHVDARMKVTPSESGLHFLRWMENSPPPPTYRKAVPALGEHVDRWQEFEFTVPGNIVQWSGALNVGSDAVNSRDQSGGFSLRVFHGLTPETEETCFYFWSTVNDYRHDDPQATEDLFREVAIAFNEDKLIVEAQQDILSKTGETRLIDIASDAARIHMRRVVKRLIAEEAGEASAKLQQFTNDSVQS